MKKILTVLQWVLSALFLVCTLGNGFHWSSLLFLSAAALMMPLPFVRSWLDAKKLKRPIIIGLSVIIFFVGILCTQPQTDDDPNDSAPPPQVTQGTTAPPETSATTTASSQQATQSTPSSAETPSQTTAVSTLQSSTSASGTTADTPRQTTQSTAAVSQTTSAEPPEITSASSTAYVGNGAAKPVDPATLPQYSGNPYVVVDNNVPSFVGNELTVIAYEAYSPLDDLGRCGVAIASCGREIMPAPDEERGNISNVTPSGWVQAQYDGISGGYLWNRCHLIGWQLSAENANRSNLITGTKYLNISGMLPFENMIADYIKETGNHVAFRVTPIFEGSNLVCSGVQLEAYSIEDTGDGIQFNVYCYNVQPGITIDYATGNSSDGSSDGDGQTGDSPAAPDSGDTDLVWIPSSGTKYHSTSTCSNMKDPAQVTKEYAEQKGYEPCKKCY